MHPKQTKFLKWENKGELQTFVDSKRTKIWLWTAVDHFQAGILGWVLGRRDAKTFGSSGFVLIRQTYVNL